MIFMKRPVLVIILVVVWILIGINMFDSGIGWLKAHNATQLFEELKSGDDISNKAFGIIGMIIKHHTLMGIIWVVIGLFTLVSAFYFLRLRAWARTALEILSWFGLVLAVASVALFISTWIFLAPLLKELDISPVEMEIPEISYLYNTIIYMSVFLVVYLSAVILMIILLRGKTVHNAVKSSSNSGIPVTGIRGG